MATALYAMSHNLSMPHRIIQPCIVAGVKPYQLVAALMAEENIGPSPLAKKIGKPKLQPQLHRFINGEVGEPRRSTMEPVAKYFKLPIEALYDEKLASAIAKERGVTALPPGEKKQRRPREQLSGNPPAVAGDELAARIAHLLQMIATAPPHLRLLAVANAETAVMDVRTGTAEVVHALQARRPSSRPIRAHQEGEGTRPK
jgi:hypothetical protein